MEIGFYERYLQNYLAENYFPQVDDEGFITDRCEIAYDVFDDWRRQGLSVGQAQELAIETLMKDFELSAANIVFELFERYYRDVVPEYLYQTILIDMQGKGLLDDFPNDKSYSHAFLESPKGIALIRQLTDIIDKYISTYGL